VDKKPGFRGTLHDALVARGAHLIDVRSRDKALEALRVHAVDLIVLDMNVQEGLETCRAIRGCWDVPIVIVSTCDRAEDKVEALDGGADDFVSRPFIIDELLARIRVALRRTAIPVCRMPERDLVRLPCGHHQTKGEILRLAASISASRQETPARPGVGRPKKIATCRKCGESGGTLEMRSHKCCAGNMAAMTLNGNG
jgi:DNA-binding response OmpR family regulator